MNKVPLFILLFLLTTGTFTTTLSSVLASSELVEDSWTTLTSMDDPCSGLGLVAVNGKLYAIGGIASVDTLGRLDRVIVGDSECYDPATDTWTTLKPMPTPRCNFIIVTCQGKIYCIGGEDGPIYPLGPSVLHPLDIVEVYDPLIDVWESRASIPINIQHDMQAQVVKDQIFIITSKGELYMYNTIADKWSLKTPLPAKEKPLQTLVINEQLFVITQSIMYMYNPVTGTWLNKTNMPASMIYAFSDVMDNKIVVGDFLLIPSTETIWMGLFNAQLRVSIYDPTSGVWFEGKTTDEHIFATNPIFNGATVIMTSDVYAPKNVYVLGIEATKEDLMNVKPFTWVYDPVSDVWSTAKVVDTAPYIRGCTIVVVDDIFYIVSDNFNVKYVPAGYNSQGHPNTQTSATAPSKSGYMWSFLTGRVVLAIIILVIVAFAVIVLSLFFYMCKRKRTVQ